MVDPLPPLTMVTPEVAAFIMRKISSLEWRRAIDGARGTNPELARRLGTQATYLRQGARWWVDAIEARGSEVGSAEVAIAEVDADSEGPPSLDTAAVALKISKSPRWVRVLIKREALRATRVGRTWLIDPDSVDEYLMRSA